MKVKVAFCDIDLSIEIEGSDIIDLIDLATKTLFKMRKMIMNEEEKGKLTRERSEIS